MTPHDPRSGGLSRRTFLQGVAAALAAGPAVHLLGSPGWGGSAGALGSTLPVGTPVLVLVELAGGNDVLNTVVPFDVPDVTAYYRSARPTIAVDRRLTTRPYGPPTQGDYLPPSLDLDGQWALHGALPWLANRWHTSGDVAIVKGTGENVVRDMSHFAAFAYKWAGAFGGSLMNTGWLGRYNDLANPDQPLGAVSMSGAHQALASLHSPSVAIADLDQFSFRVDNVPGRDRWLQSLADMGTASPTGSSKVGTAAEALELARQASATAQGVTRLPSAGSSGSLAYQMATAASLIRGGVPCQTYVATLGGFDTHGSEPYNHWERLTLLNEGLSHLFSLIDGTERAGDVFVVIQSEFGRQVSQNAGQGTDHGLASDHILVGGGVQGGLYGQTPAFAPGARHADALVPTVDFRSVYATVLNRLGGDPSLTSSALGADESGQAFADLGVFSGPAGSSAVASGAAADGGTAPTPDAPADLQPYLEAAAL